MGGEKDRRPRGQNRGGGQSRDVQISKALSLLLRHAAEKEGLKINAQGYANVTDVLQWRKLKSIKCSFDEIKHAVESSDKKRFALLHIPSSFPKESTTTAIENPGSGVNNPDETHSPATSALEAPSTTEEQTSTTEQALSMTDDNPANYLIRATQGHSMKTVEAASFLEPLSLDNQSKIPIPDTVVHGTFHGAWPLILQSGGLKCMTRHHVHFATGPSLQSVLAAQQEDQGEAKQETKENKVISGMRRDAQVLIYIDIRKAMEAGCPFWRSENGVILSEGLPLPNAQDDTQRVVPVEFFDVVVEQKVKMGKIWEKGQVLQELPANLTKKANPKNRQ